MSGPRGRRPGAATTPPHRIRRFGTGLLALGLASGCGAPTPDETADPPTLFEGARLVVGDGTVLERGAFLVEGSRITGVGAQVEAPAGARRVDLTGKTVIPAMIDAHAHLGYEGYTRWGSDAYSRENLIEHLERYAYYGFAAVFSAGTDPDDMALELQQAQERGEVGGARLLFATGMAPPGQGPNNQFLEHALVVEARTGMTVLRGAATPEQGRAAVRDVASKGIRFIKIWVDDRGGTQEKLPPDVYRVIIDEARTHGVAVLVHQQTTADMPPLLDAGVTGFLHGRLGPDLDAVLAGRIASAGAFLVPNLGLGELRSARVADDPFLQEATPPSVVARLGSAYDAREASAGAAGLERPSARPADDPRERPLRDSFRHLLDAGVDVVLGTDAGALPDHFFGYTGHRELEIFVRLGMTPGQAIVAATSAPAAHFGLDDLGTLVPGKSADFVVLDGNPLSNIRNTQAISRVFLRGVEVDRTWLRRSFTSGG